MEENQTQTQEIKDEEIVETTLFTEEVVEQDSENILKTLLEEQITEEENIFVSPDAKWKELQEENFSLKESLNGELKKKEKIERAIHILKEKADRDFFEKERLEENFKELQEKFENLQSLSEIVKTENNKLVQYRDLERLALQENQEELFAIQYQFEDLKKKYWDVKEEHTVQKEALELIQKENEFLKEKVKELEDSLKNFQKEIQEIAIERGKHQDLLREKESEKEQVVKEREEFKLKLQKKEEDSLKKIFLLQSQCLESSQKEISQEKEIALLKAQLEEKERRFQEKETSEKELLDKLLLAEEGNQRLLNEQEAYKEALKEEEEKLKVAQQHLAKKMKETAGFTDEKEALLREIKEKADGNDTLKLKLQEAESRLSISSDQEKRLQEQIGKWEEKYFSVYDKWQAIELRNRELLEQEEKYHQMKALITNIGAFMNVAAVTPKSAPEKPIQQTFVVDTQKLMEASTAGEKIGSFDEALKAPKGRYYSLEDSLE